MTGLYLINFIVLVMSMVPVIESNAKKVSCAHSSDCGGVADTMCVSDFCQPSPCHSDKQCVKGQACAHQKNHRDCAYRTHVDADESDRVTLRFPNPAPDGTYDMIRWYKGMNMWSVAYYDRNETGMTPKYFDEYCIETSCDTSDRALLNPTTGELTILDVRLRDEDYYYFRFYVSGEEEQGAQHQIMLEVSTLGGKIEIFLAVTVTVVVVLGIIICVLVLYKRVKKFQRRYNTIYGRKHEQTEKPEAT